MTTSTGPDGRPFAFHDLPESAFPVTLRAWFGDRLVWERVIEPYVVVEIPGAAPELRGKLRIQALYATGEQHWEGP